MHKIRWIATYQGIHGGEEFVSTSVSFTRLVGNESTSTRTYYNLSHKNCSYLARIIEYRAKEIHPTIFPDCTHLLIEV